MDTSRRDFVRRCAAGLGSAVGVLSAGQAWGDQRRILGGSEGPAGIPWTTAASPELREFLPDVRSRPAVQPFQDGGADPYRPFRLHWMGRRHLIRRLRPPARVRPAVLTCARVDVGL